MKGKFIIKIDMSSNKKTLIGELVSLINDTLICRNAIYDNDDYTCHQDVCLKLTSISSFTPVNDIDYLQYIKKINQNKANVSTKNEIDCSIQESVSCKVQEEVNIKNPEYNVIITPKQPNEIFESDIDLTLDDDTITYNVNKALDSNNDVLHDQLISKDDSSCKNNLTFFKRMIILFSLVIKKICLLTLILKPWCKTIKPNIKVEEECEISDIELDLGGIFNLDDQEKTASKIQRTDLATIPKVIENIFEVFNSRKDNFKSQYKNENNKTIDLDIIDEDITLSIAYHQEQNDLVLKKVEDENDVLSLSCEDDVHLLMTNSSIEDNLNDSINNKSQDKEICDNSEILIKKDILDLPEPTVVHSYNSPSFIRYLEEKRANEMRYKKKLSLTEIKRLEEKKQNFNSKGFYYGKQHHLYISNEKKYTFDKNSVCKYTGKYNYSFQNSQQVLYLLNSKELKNAYKSKSSKKYKKNKDILDDKKWCRNPIIISSVDKSNIVEKKVN